MSQKSHLYLFCNIHCNITVSKYCYSVVQHLCSLDLIRIVWASICKGGWSLRFSTKGLKVVQSNYLQYKWAKCFSLSIFIICREAAGFLIALKNEEKVHKWSTNLTADVNNPLPKVNVVVKEEKKKNMWNRTLRMGGGWGCKQLFAVREAFPHQNG